MHRMAAASETKILEEIGEDFLCCTICLEQFQSPKILPCLHTYCEKCLVTLVKKKGSLNCPECRQPCQLPAGGVSALKGNFFMRNLTETFKQRLESRDDAMKCDGCQENTRTHRCVQCKDYLCESCVKVHKNLSATRKHQLMTIKEYDTMKSTSPAKLQTAENCSIHTTNEIKFYCETCQVPICSDCTIIEHPSPEHRRRYLKDFADECLGTLKAMVDKLKVKEEEAEKNKALASQTHRGLKEEYKIEEKKVKAKAAEVINKIKTEEQRLIGELNRIFNMKIKQAAVDEDELELCHGNMKSTINYIDTLMHHGHATQIVLVNHDAERRLQKLIETASSPPMPLGKVEFIPASNFSESGILGNLASDIDASKCSVENIPKQLMKGDKANLLITSRDLMGNQVIPRQQLKAQIRGPDASWEDTEVTDNSDGTFSVTVCGQVHGQYRVDLKIDEQGITGCPIIIPVIRPVQIIGAGNTRVKFKGPTSVALNRHGDIVVADRDNNKLPITTVQGKLKKTLEFRKFKKPFQPGDIAVSPDNLYFSLDDNNNQIVVSDEDGHVIKCFGKGHLEVPQGIAISPVNGDVFVTDSDIDKVCIYTQKGKYVTSFYVHDDQSLPTLFVMGITVGRNGMVFVVSNSKSCVEVFSPNYEYMYSFGDSGNGKLNSPVAIAIEDDKYLYVTDKGRILKFDMHGNFVRLIADGLSNPFGIALTNDVPCRVIVADYGDHCVKVISQ